LALSFQRKISGRGQALLLLWRCFLAKIAQPANGRRSKRLGAQLNRSRKFSEIPRPFVAKATFIPAFWNSFPQDGWYGAEHRSAACFRAQGYRFQSVNCSASCAGCAIREVRIDNRAKYPLHIGDFPLVIVYRHWLRSAELA